MAHPVDIYVGKRLRFRRKEIGMSQGDLGAKLEVTFQQIQKYEKGTNRIGASRLFELADALNVEVGYFFEGLKVDDNATASLFDADMTPQMVRLIKAFINIGDPSVLTSTLHLIEGIAGTKPEEAASVSDAPAEGFHDAVSDDKGLCPKS